MLFLVQLSHERIKITMLKDDLVTSINNLTAAVKAIPAATTGGGGGSTGGSVADADVLAAITAINEQTAILKADVAAPAPAAAAKTNPLAL